MTKKISKPRVVAYRQSTMYGDEWVVRGNGRKLTKRETEHATAALNVYFDGIRFSKKIK